MRFWKCDPTEKVREPAAEVFHIRARKTAAALCFTRRQAMINFVSTNREEPLEVDAQLVQTSSFSVMLWLDLLKEVISFFKINLNPIPNL